MFYVDLDDVYDDYFSIRLYFFSLLKKSGRMALFRRETSCCLRFKNIDNRTAFQIVDFALALASRDKSRKLGDTVANVSP